MTFTSKRLYLAKLLEKKGNITSAARVYQSLSKSEKYYSNGVGNKWVQSPCPPFVHVVANYILIRIIETLQRVQNCLARVVCKASRFSRSKRLLNFLHWLPVKYRIRFKLCTITFKAFLFHQPTYIFNYLVPLQNSRLLTSSNTIMLSVPRFRTKWGSRAFAVAAPSTWNSLPVNLRTANTVTSLKKMLKTFLFNSAFPPPPLIPLSSHL